MNALKKPHSQSAVILSAVFGGYDQQLDWAKQNSLDGMPIGHCRFNDENMPGRELAMTSRMKPALVKMFGWDLVPGFDFYIWVDGSKTITSPDFGKFMLEQLGKADLAIFRHPERKTIEEEYVFVRKKLEEGNEYLRSRYSGEFLDEQYRVIVNDRVFKDTTLYASTGFAYRPNAKIKMAFKEWWFHKTRYLLHDQLALPFVLARAKVKVNVIDANIYKFPYWEHTRKRR